MKKETLDLVEQEVKNYFERYKNSGHDVEIVHLPCIVIRGSKGEVGGMVYPNTATIVRSENKDINL